MKKLLLLLSLLCCLSARAYYVDFNTMSNYVAAALSGYSPGGGGAGANTPPLSVNSPTVFWTNNVGTSFWITNASFQVFMSGLPSSNQYSATLVVSNYGAAPIIATLPFTAYSLSQATNVTGAVIPAGTALSLLFQSNPNGVIYVTDNGANNTTLLSLAASLATANGFLYGNAGIVQSTTNLFANTFNAQQGVYANYFNNYPNTFGGISFQSYDSLGNVWMNLQNRAGANGLVVSNATLDLADLTQFGNAGVSGNDRFEHRTAYLTNALNTAGERQFLFGTVVGAAFGLNGSVIFSTLATAGEVTSNLTVTAGFITNRNLIYCTTTNLGPLNTNYIYVGMIPPGGWIYTSSNTGTASGSIWSRH